jgi:hypothetical protein
MHLVRGFTGVDSEPEEDLLAAAGESNGNSDTQPLSQDFQANLSNDEFQVELDGLAPSDVQSLTEAGNSVPIQSATAPAGGATVAATPDELVDGEDGLTHADDATINQQTGATVVPNDASITVQTAMDSFNASVPNSQSTAQDDFFFDGTDNNDTTNTNVWEMYLEDTQLGLQGQKHYETGTTYSATGWDCADIVQQAVGQLVADVKNDPNRTIDIVGFSRGSAGRRKGVITDFSLPVRAGMQPSMARTLQADQPWGTNIQAQTFLFCKTPPAANEVSVT